MKIVSNFARSRRSASALKSVSTLTLAVLGAFCGAGPAWSAPILGSDLASFAVLGAAGVTHVTTSTIGGNLGSAPNGSVGGGYVFSSGSLQANTALAQNAQIQLDAAILAVNANGPGTLIAGGNLDAWQISHGGFIIPGTYTVPYALTNLVGNLVLDGSGSNTAVWNFLFTSSLITSSTSNVSVQNVGDGSGVGLYWTVASAATLNGPTFAGNVLAHDLISSDGDLTITCGRLLSAETKVTLINDKVSITGCAGNNNGFDQGVSVSIGPVEQTVPEPSTLALLGLAFAALGLARHRHN